MEILIDNNIFDSNFAQTEGGAIKWMNIMPLITEKNVYYNNVAQYGANIAAYPIRLIVDIHNKTTFVNANNLSSLLLNGSDENIRVLDNVNSGTEFPYVIVTKIIDIYGNIVKLDNA